MKRTYESAPLVREAFESAPIKEACVQFSQYTADDISRDIERRHRDYVVYQQMSESAARKEGYEEGYKEGYEKVYKKEGEEEGLKEGEEKGLKKGLREGKIATVRNFKALGVGYDVIAQATGLSIEEIEKIE
jgi:predicted transposase/invertase (TIGR01784 family)